MTGALSHFELSFDIKCSMQTTRHLLSDGTGVVLRPISAADKAELQLGLRRLSPESVQRRFLAPKPRFTEAELRYLTEVDGHDHVALVVELEDRPGMVLGVARYVRLPDQDGVAEPAIVVADFLQGKGLGTLLAKRLAEEAVANGIHRFAAIMLGENRPAQRLMSRLTDHLETHAEAGILEAATELAA
jgi:RimJ/RimL family protein N-acetyltransferase